MWLLLSSSFTTGCHKGNVTAFHLLTTADDVVFGLAGGGGQQVGDGLEDGADGLGRDTFFLGLDAECGDQRCELLDVNHKSKSLCDFTSQSYFDWAVW